MQAIRLARPRANIQRRFTRSLYSAVNGATPPRQTCYNCGLPGHFSRECPKGRICYKCGMEGHLSHECSQSIAAGSGGGRYGYGGVSGGGGSKTCNTCGGVGHLSRDCAQSKCFNCSGIGHISRDCTQPRRRECYTCGSEGHISRDCPGVNE